MQPQNRSRAGHPVWVVTCLLAFLSSAPQVLPSVTAMLAWIDGEHHVSVTMDAQSMRVVLSHDQSGELKSPHHLHCALTRAITALAEPAPFQGPHILNFCSGYSYSFSLRSAPIHAYVPNGNGGWLSPLPWSSDAAERFAWRSTAPVDREPPPLMPLRTVVLLI